MHYGRLGAAQGARRTMRFPAVRGAPQHFVSGGMLQTIGPGAAAYSQLQALRHGARGKGAVGCGATQAAAGLSSGTGAPGSGRSCAPARRRWRARRAHWQPRRAPPP